MKKSFFKFLIALLLLIISYQICNGQLGDQTTTNLGKESSWYFAINYHKISSIFFENPPFNSINNMDEQLGFSSVPGYKIYLGISNNDSLENNFDVFYLSFFNATSKGRELEYREYSLGYLLYPYSDKYSFLSLYTGMEVGIYRINEPEESEKSYSINWYCGLSMKLYKNLRMNTSFIMYLVRTNLSEGANISLFDYELGLSYEF